jgi:hypothetical protein
MIALLAAGCLGLSVYDSASTHVDRSDTALPTQPDVDCDLTPPCSGGDCPQEVTSVVHTEWFDRLTESPEVSWEGGNGIIELSIGTAPGETDVWCWSQSDAESWRATALWLQDGATYYVNARTRSGAQVSTTTTSDGWTVDIVPADEVPDISDQFATTRNTVSWIGGASDAASGFSHYEVAFGSLPGAADLQSWTDVGTATTYTFDMAKVTQDHWGYSSVRTADIAGNTSIETSSVGFIRCPDQYIFIPGTDTQGIETEGFCLAKYEMRIAGQEDGNQGYSSEHLPESRASGTPWANLLRASGALACNALGTEYTLISNRRWQVVARNLENNPANWSGGAVGSGYVNRGHHDGSPSNALSSSSDDGDACYQTGNDNCTDPSHADYSNKRTHTLDNGAVIWDFTGNVKEHVDGSIGFTDGSLWTAFDDSAFTSEEGWEVNRILFGPEGDFTHAQGMGQFYAGEGNLLRGGAWKGYSAGTAGSEGGDDAGLYYGHHNVWSLDETQGFRCSYSP